VTQVHTQLARTLRQRSTSAETLLWSAVRGRRLGGLKFRRQVQIGRYIVDFACLEIRLVVELDGPCHETTEDYDRKRTEVIEASGWMVVRFPTKEVVEEREGVLIKILELARQIGRSAA
jgi:very-short-patch-repair endonuclease